MADVIIVLQVRLESPEVDPNSVIKKASEILTTGGAKVHESKVEPLAFGLKQVLITFSRDENKGSVDDLEEEISSLDEVMSTEVIGISRSLN